MNFNHPLTNIELIDLANRMNIKLNGVLMKDEATHNCPNGYYIFNLQNHNQNGTHWVALFKKSNKQYYYCDPFGIPPPETLINLLQSNEKHLFYNDTQIQHIDSILCGYYCLLFLYMMQQSKSTADNIAQFLQLFYLDTKKNDKELKKIISKLI
jgi:hypothetical protein